MNPFNLEHFTRRLIAETIFYDDEYGARVDLSLIDPNTRKERFLATYEPEEGDFVLHEATEWEEEEPTEADEIGYALAVDWKEHGRFETPEEVADVLLALARDHGLYPGVTLLFDDDEVS